MQLFVSLSWVFSVERCQCLKAMNHTKFAFGLPGFTVCIPWKQMTVLWIVGVEENRAGGGDATGGPTNEGQGTAETSLGKKGGHGSPCQKIEDDQGRLA